eukprot:RCo010325
MSTQASTPGVLAAVESGDLEVLQAWVTSPDVVNEILDDKGNTALHWACRNPQRAEVCRLLLQRGAAPNARNFLDATPLHWACKQGCTEHVRLLLQHGANQALKNNAGKTAMELASVAAVKECLAHALRNPTSMVPSSAATEIGSLSASRGSTPPHRASPKSPTSATRPPAGRLLHETLPIMGQAEDLSAQLRVLAKKRQEDAETIESLQAELAELHKERARLEGMVSGHEEIKARVEALQREKIHLGVELQQKVVEQQELARRLQEELKAEHERCMQLQKQLSAASEAEMARVEARVKVIEEHLRAESEAREGAQQRLET